MQSFEFINEERMQHGYSTNQLESYKKYCNKLKRLNAKTDSELRDLYALESNMAKFKLTGSLAYLRKSLRILKRRDNLFNELYSKYIQCFIDHRKAVISVDALIDLRNELAEFYSFLDDIYQIGDNRHNFEQYKIKYQWKDITISFETKKGLESFLNGTFSLRDFRFNTQLVNKIMKFQEQLKLFGEMASRPEVNEFEAFSCTKSLSDCISILSSFLNENFVESEYVSRCKNDSIAAQDFFKKLLEFKTGTIHHDIDEFRTPELFKEFDSFFSRMKANKKIKPSKLYSMLLDIVEKKITIDETQRSMPFSPVFYDLAYDFIEYKSQDTPVSKLLRSFNIFNKR